MHDPEDKHFVWFAVFLAETSCKPDCPLATQVWCDFHLVRLVSRLLFPVGAPIRPSRALYSRKSLSPRLG
jgi:hypothetical protein